MFDGLMPEELEKYDDDTLDAVEAGVEQPIETVFDGIENVGEYVTGHPYYHEMKQMFEDTFGLKAAEEAPQSERELAQNGQQPGPGAGGPTPTDESGGFDPMSV
jgi:hypothetical protein